MPILGRRADLVGEREDGLVAVELKMRDWREALRQATAYQLAASRVWVAMPLAGASSAYHQRWRFEAEQVGLLAVDDRDQVRVPIPAGPSPRLLPFVRERVLNPPVRPARPFLRFDWMTAGLGSEDPETAAPELCPEALATTEPS